MTVKQLPERALQMIGATARSNERYAWSFGTDHDYYMEASTGRVLGEVSRKTVNPQSPTQDELWAVSFVIPFGEPPVDLPPAPPPFAEVEGRPIFSQTQLWQYGRICMAQAVPSPQFYAARAAAREAMERKFNGD